MAWLLLHVISVKSFLGICHFGLVVEISGNLRVFLTKGTRGDRRNSSLLLRGAVAGIVVIVENFICHRLTRSFLVEVLILEIEGGI